LNTGACASGGFRGGAQGAHARSLCEFVCAMFGSMRGGLSEQERACAAACGRRRVPRFFFTVWCYARSRADPRYPASNAALAAHVQSQHNHKTASTTHVGDAILVLAQPPALHRSLMYITYACTSSLKIAWSAASVPGVCFVFHDFCACACHACHDVTWPADPAGRRLVPRQSHRHRRPEERLRSTVEVGRGHCAPKSAPRGADALIRIALLTSRVGRCGNATGGGVPSAPSPGYNAPVSLAFALVFVCSCTRYSSKYIGLGP
jgi:hypothetical protein